MLEVVKRATYALAAHGGPAAIGRRARRRDAVVLAYHNVIGDDERPIGDRSLHLHRRDFAAQLDALGETHDIVPLSALLEPAAADGRRPRAAITFDDAYLGAVTLGLAELARRRLPATVFVVAGAVGGRTFWWDSLATDGEVPQGIRHEALEAFQGRHEAVMGWARTRGLVAREEADLPPHWTTAGEAELHAATGAPGVTLASHSWGHANLARLEPAALAAEMADSARWLRERFPSAAPWISYPYGSYSSAVERAAAAAGYAAGFRVEGGYLVGRTAREAMHALPRVNVPSGASLDRFITLTSGIY